MAGRDAARGFLYQGFASVLEALTDENSWDKIYVDFPSDQDKVDIALEERGKIFRCIQVKSTVNMFSRQNVQDWIRELVNDFKSPEYELILIGQCERAANTFIKSVEKYYNGELDREAESALDGFDRALFQNTRFCFSVLPFKVEVLEQIARDSLHKYISQNNCMLTFEQINFIAATMVHDQMTSSLHREGMDRSEFDKKIEERILLLASEYPSKRIPITVKSFQAAVENPEEAESSLSLIDKFSGRELKSEYRWNDDIYKRLEEFLLGNVKLGSAYRLFLDAHLSIAFAAGRILNSKTGINICPVQKTPNQGMVLWDIERMRETDFCNWDITNEQLQEGRPDQALVLNVTHDIRDEVKDFIKNQNLPVGRMINCVPSKTGATNISIKDGTHASFMANSVCNALAGRSISERRATLHIFASAPSAFMFLLGQLSHGFGKCILYEYDFEQKNSCTYSPSLHFPNEKQA